MPIKISPHIRWMIRRDMPEVLAIEKPSFEFPWSDEEFVRCLRLRTVVGMVAEFSDCVVGYMIFEIRRTNLDLLNFTVHPEFRRRGIGTAMMERLQSKLHCRPVCKRVTLDVRETNLGAQLFFRAVGFKAISVLHDLYDNTPEDGYLMELRIATRSLEEQCT